LIVRGVCLWVIIFFGNNVNSNSLVSTISSTLNEVDVYTLMCISYGLLLNFLSLTIVYVG